MRMNGYRLTRGRAIAAGAFVALSTYVAVVLVDWHHERQNARERRLELLRRIVDASDGVPDDPAHETVGPLQIILDPIPGVSEESMRRLAYRVDAVGPKLLNVVRLSYFRPGNWVRDEFDSADLSALLYMLMDEKSSVIWSELAIIVSRLDAAEMSAPVIIDYIERPYSFNPHNDQAGSERLDALRALGTLGGSDAVGYLRAALNRKGAERVVSNWWDGRLPRMFSSTRSVVARVQRIAALGLIETNEPGNIDLVEQMHADMRTQAIEIRGKKRNSAREREFIYLFDGLAESLVRRDLLQMAKNGTNIEELMMTDIHALYAKYDGGSDDGIYKLGIRRNPDSF